MTHCTDFWHKWRKEPNFCGLSPQSISEIKGYLELVDKIVKTGITEETVFENCPSGACRPLLRLSDDETRVKGLNYIVSCLKRKEKVTQNDLQTTIAGWLKKEVCKLPESTQLRRTKEPLLVETPIAPLHPSLAQQVRKQEMAEAEKNQPAPVEEPEPVVVPPPRPPTPAPCLSLKGCPDFQNHIDTSNKILGRVCNVIRIPCNQLPGPDKECPLERKDRLKDTPPAAFVRASGMMDELDAAKPIKPVPLKISKVRLTDSERDSYCDALVERTGFTAKDIEQIDELVTAGYDGCKCRFDLVETAVMQYLAKAEGA